MQWFYIIICLCKSIYDTNMRAIKHIDLIILKKQGFIDWKIIIKQCQFLLNRFNINNEHNMYKHNLVFFAKILCSFWKELLIFYFEVDTVSLFCNNSEDYVKKRKKDMAYQCVKKQNNPYVFFLYYRSSEKTVHNEIGMVEKILT